MNKKYLNGFTLIELLVVISIIAVLMSILMPALSKVREQAKTSVCGSNVKQMVQAFYLYQTSNKGWFPPRYEIDSKNQRINAWTYRIAPYMSIEDGLVTTWGTPANEVKGWNGPLNVFKCPSGVKEARRESFKRYYSINTWGLGAAKPFRHDQVSGNKILLVDHYHIDIWNRLYSDFNYDSTKLDNGPEENIAAKNFAMKPVHGKGYNYGFIDGSAAFQTGSKEEQWVNGR